MKLRPLHLGLLERLDDLDAEEPGAWWGFTLVCGRDVRTRTRKAPYLAELVAWEQVEMDRTHNAYRIAQDGVAVRRATP